METTRENKMKIFISHSQKDKDVAAKFKTIFEVFGEYWMSQTDVEIFLSSDFSNEQRTTSQWRDNFEAHLNDSSVFIVLVTPNSLNSRWVQYEIGYVSAKNATRDMEKQIQIYQIGIGGVSPESCLLRDTYIEIIENKDDVIKTFTKIFPVSKKLAEGWYKDNKNNIDDLVVCCNKRCVYFVGSKPKDELGKVKWSQVFVNYFLDTLTETLIDRGVKVSSFPTVEAVGKRVFTAAMKNAKYYEVAGLYGFDKKPNKKIDAETWKKSLDEYRKLYLENKSSMIIVGGNKHTLDEYGVAKELGNIEIFPIPCMGGTGEKIYVEKSKYDNDFKKYNHPCYECYQSGDYKNRVNGCKCERIPQFAERLGKYFFNENEWK